MKHTKGKQKIEMKQVKSYADRVITFSKRRSGIFKKMNEMVSLCDVETAFLGFSEAGNPYTFAYPSLEEAFGWLNSPLKHEASASINTKPLVEAYKRQRANELMKKYVDLVEELDMNNEKEKILMKSKKEKKMENMWWNISLEDFSVETLKIRHQMLLDMHVSVNAMALKHFGKDSDGSSSGQEESHG